MTYELFHVVTFTVTCSFEPQPEAYKAPMAMIDEIDPDSLMKEFYEEHRPATFDPSAAWWDHVWYSADIELRRRRLQQRPEQQPSDYG